MAIQRKSNIRDQAEANSRDQILSGSSVKIETIVERVEISFFFLRIIPTYFHVT